MAGRTIPAEPKAQERYAREGYPGVWTVFDWYEDTPGEWRAEELVEGLSEADARLLVFGAQLVAGLRNALSRCPCGAYGCVNCDRDRAVLANLEVPK